MKKLISVFTILAVAVWVLGPVMVIGNNTVQTGLTKGTGGGQAPIVKVKWEMLKDTNGEDDRPQAGAQFDPPGQWGDIMEYTVCAIVTDPNGADDIYGVYADIFYPDPDNNAQNGRRMHKYSYNYGTGEYTQLEDPDNPTGGCGAFIEENTLQKLSKDEGYDLFCNHIRDSNNNLPVFASGYDYDEICADDGELMKEEAYVYCSDKYLIWEDPAGLYKVDVFALDNAGNRSNDLTNHFEYLPFTAFQRDFDKINYGEVLLNVHKKLSGDKEFKTGCESLTSETDCNAESSCYWYDNACYAKPTVRNVGNTRLYVRIAQDDMGLGKSSDQWNVKYDARVGNAESDWRNYWPAIGKDAGTPTAYTTLYEILDLSEIEEMDFSVIIYKWPNANASYTGEMWLDASKAPWESCT